jgi:hypothetical protein
MNTDKYRYCVQSLFSDPLFIDLLSLNSDKIPLNTSSATVNSDPKGTSLVLSLEAFNSVFEIDANMDNQWRI